MDEGWFAGPELFLGRAGGKTNMTIEFRVVTFRDSRGPASESQEMNGREWITYGCRRGEGTCRMASVSEE